MNPLLKKLNLKTQTQAIVLQHPAEFESTLFALKDIVETDLNIGKKKVYDFILVFVLSNKDIANCIKQLDGHLQDDATLWFAYIKKSSKKYKAGLSRDGDGWLALGEYGYEGVRQVAIDADWSALRFRHVDHIKSMTRHQGMALSKKGRERTGKK